MFSTYRPEDVTILLKDITGLVEPLDTAERENASSPASIIRRCFRSSIPRPRST